LLPSLREYVLIEQKESRVDVFRRSEQGLWVLEGYKDLDAMVELRSIDVSIAVADIYQWVKF
jgi:Uma2 family endonuclease